MKKLYLFCVFSIFLIGLSVQANNLFINICPALDESYVTSLKNINDNSIFYAGTQAFLTVSHVTDRTLEFILAPIGENGRPIDL